MEISQERFNHTDWKTTIRKKIVIVNQVACEFTYYRVRNNRPKSEMAKIWSKYDVFDENLMKFELFCDEKTPYVAAIWSF